MHVVAVDPAQLLQPVQECLQTGTPFLIVRCRGHEYADALFGLLCECDERPRYSRPADKRYEIAPPHVCLPHASLSQLKLAQGKRPPKQLGYEAFHPAAEVRLGVKKRTSTCGLRRVGFRSQSGLNAEVAFCLFRANRIILHQEINGSDAAVTQPDASSYPDVG